MNGGAVASFKSLLLLLLLFGIIEIPLVFAGYRVGDTAPCITVPTKTSDVIRPIPESEWTSRKPFVLFVGGFLIFAMLYAEFHYVMNSLWLSKYYGTMGFLLVESLVAVIVCAESSILICYLQLREEDHRWWWVSFCGSSSAGVFTFLYSLWFLENKMTASGVLSVVVYLICMAMVSILVGIVFGSIGVLSSLLFTRSIFGMLDIDEHSSEDGSRTASERFPLMTDSDKTLDSQ